MKGDGPQTKVHYKGTEDDFIVFIAGTEILKKWKEDKSIPLVEVVQSFDVFVTSKCDSNSATIAGTDPNLRMFADESSHQPV